MAFYTTAGNKFAAALTEWLQDTRLMSEAVYRLYTDHQKTGKVTFSSSSWPKPKKGELPLKTFEIKPVPLSQRIDGLLKALWRSQFIFLETLWEEYLQDLVLELRHKDVSIFEPFCEKDFMAGIVSEVLLGNLDSIDEIKDESAARFAAGITRKPWKEQWGQLIRLDMGLKKTDEALSWFGDLDVYFEMRNCVIHRQGKVSSLLHSKASYFKTKGVEVIEIWPQHLDWYRHKFIDCVGFIEGKIEAKFKARQS